MSDFKKLRNEMVETQIITRGISDKKVINILRKIPREKFIDKKFIEEAYDDHPIPIGENQTISQPYIVALMTELLRLKGNEKILEIGTGSGYQTAILAELSKEVYSIERISSLYEKTKKTLQELGYKNIFLFNSDGSEGLKDFAPYDRIIVTAAGNEIPQPLEEQLAENGRIVMPVGDRFMQNLIMADKINNKLHIINYGAVTFVPLIGKHGISI
ncbi:MAG: protein-L-isoaspartate O-methyltransferase [Elusimicrobia bacterium RIFOXYD2_FULL_34_15]|nr:MAG: protein-L-isoaspartate O-methyltransferase [Elusimicrobia bacterium RIFOXYD2_FULL_34_15]